MNTSSNPEQTRCAHCLAPIETRGEDVEGPITSPHKEGGAPLHFCCVGCKSVYHTLNSLGLDDFYQWRDMDGDALSCPAPLPETIRGGHDFSADIFLEHARTHEDGTLEAELGLKGISCSGCVWIIEQMPEFVSGVLEAHVNLTTSRLLLRWDPRTLTDPELIFDWLARFGYGVTPLRLEAQHRHDAQERAMLRRVGVSWALTGNVMLLSWAHYAGLGIDSEPALALGSSLLMWALVTVSVWYGGGLILQRARHSILATARALWRHHKLLPLSMDVPLSIGILIGWLYSSYAVWRGFDELWFDSIAMLIAAIMTARWLQQRANARAKLMASQMLDIIPRVAHRILEDGDIEAINSEELVSGDVIQLRLGDVCPADGVILRGEGALHRGVLTGESRPEQVGCGDLVEAGTKNVSGTFELRVQAVGAHSRLGQLLEWVQANDASRSSAMQRVDRLGGWFVLIILSLVALAGLVWWQLDASRAPSIMIAMLVISCPCAIGMATPLAMALTMAHGARRGIFIKHDDALETLDEVDHVVFDKTGTLTRGEMRLTRVQGEREHLALAQLLEERSAHPIALAMRDLVELQPWERKGLLERIDQVREIPACGMEALLDGELVLLGKPSWVLEQGAARGAMEPLAIACESVARQGDTPLLMRRGEELVAMFGVGDALQAGAKDALTRLIAQNIRVTILSGDHPSLVRMVGEELLGLPEGSARGGLSPEEKLAQIMRMKEQGDTVMMVGDGVNDAVAMQEANVGVAVRGGADVSVVAADIFLTNQGIEPVLELLHAGASMRRLVQRNVAWLIAYNVFGIMLAATGHVTPLIAAILMPLSSLGLVLITISTRILARPMSPPTHHEPSAPLTPRESFT